MVTSFKDKFWYKWCNKKFAILEKELLEKYSDFAQDLDLHKGYIELTMLAFENFIIHKNMNFNAVTFSIYVIDEDNTKFTIANISHQGVSLASAGEYRAYIGDKTPEEMAERVNHWWGYLVLKYKHE